MKKRNETYQKWINATYFEFAHEGLGFSLKALSEKPNCQELRTTITLKARRF